MDANSAAADRKDRAQAWFRTLQSDILDVLERLEVDAPAALFGGEPGKFERTPWSRAPETGADGQPVETGGGVMGTAGMNAAREMQKRW